MKILSRLVCALSVLACPLAMHADTLSLVSVGGTVSGGEEIYPYNFSFNGSNTLISLMCINLDRTITMGETWNVTKSVIGQDTSSLASAYRADAYIYSLLGKYSTSDVQYAAWSILDPTDAKNNSAWTPTAQYLANLGTTEASDAALISSGFFNNYVVYNPTADQTGWTAGRPQSFVGLAVTPEPSSLGLLFTGALCSGLEVLRRRRTRTA